MRPLVLVLGAMVGACGGEPTTTYGPPNGLSHLTPPEPAGMPASSSGSGSSSGPASSGGNGSSSSSSSGSGSGSGSGGATNGPDGSAPKPDSGSTTTCAVSWATNVFSILKSTGDARCASAACHAGASPPTITDADPATAYATLAAYSINGVHYLVAGNGNPADSSIECNLGITQPSCGLLVMPQSPGALSAADKQTIDTWVRCGAPQN